MTPIEIERAIAVEINTAEVAIAACAAALARADALATEEFEANYDAESVNKTAGKATAAMQAAAKTKVRLVALHASLLATSATATFPRPRSGK